MAEDHFNLVTSGAIRAKVAAKFGLDQTSAVSSIDRSKFSSDSEYLDAVAREEALRKNPVYQKARCKAAVELLNRDEQAEIEAQQTEFKRIRSNMKLSDFEVRQIDEKALQFARGEVAAGRMSVSGMGKAIQDYAAALTEEKLNTKSSNQLFNQMLRGAVIGAKSHDRNT